MDKIKLFTTYNFVENLEGKLDAPISLEEYRKIIKGPSGSQVNFAEYLSINFENIKSIQLLRYSRNEEKYFIEEDGYIRDDIYEIEIIFN